MDFNENYFSDHKFVCIHVSLLQLDVLSVCFSFSFFFFTKECVVSTWWSSPPNELHEKNRKFQKDIERTSLQLIGWDCVFYLYTH